MYFKLRPRTVLSIVSAVVVVIILFLIRHELVVAWHLLGTINIPILLLLIPAQILSYYAVGAMIFSYLKEKGDLQHTSNWEMAKMALELNFVNHVLPSAGVSGASYMTWRLQKLGVGGARATLAQVIRFVVTFAAFSVLLVISVVLITIDGSVSRLVLLASSGLVSVIAFGTLVLIYVFNSSTRLNAFSRFLGATINNFGKRFLRRKKNLLDQIRIDKFFNDLHEDYLIIKAEPHRLKKPLLWGFVSNLAEVSLFIIVFLALGTLVNPAQVLIAYGIATIAGVFLVTPGGIGGYEALMIFVLTASGLPAGLVLSGVLLTRILLIVGTIASGYVFYQLALNKYGKHSA